MKKLSDCLKEKKIQINYVHSPNAFFCYLARGLGGVSCKDIDAFFDWGLILDLRFWVADFRIWLRIVTGWFF